MLSPDAEREKLGNEATRIAELDATHRRLRSQVESLQGEVDGGRHELARVNQKASDAEELRKRLNAERERNDSLNVHIAKHMEIIKESNQRFSDLVERNNVLDKLLQKQQKEKESKFGVVSVIHWIMYHIRVFLTFNGSAQIFWLRI